MHEVDLGTYKKVRFGNNVSIKAETIILGEGSYFGDNVSIEAREVIIGFDAVIEEGTVIRGLGKPMNKFKLGDNTLIGFRNQLLIPHFEMLDYSQLHNSGLHSGYETLTIGFNCWIGQNTILNATDRLEIGNNVRIGTQSQLWTHVASGELLEGCTLYAKKPLILRDNVWVVGGAIISPGLLLGENSIIMTGAVLTKSTPPFSTLAGIPAIDVTDKLTFWKRPSLDEKFILINKFINEFLFEKPQYKKYVTIREQIDEKDLNKMNRENLVIVKKAEKIKQLSNSPCSIFDLNTKYYIKKRTQIEIDWIKFSVGYRARFIPLENA